MEPDSKAKLRSKKVLGHRVVRYIEKIVYNGWCIQVFIVVGTSVLVIKVDKRA